MPFRRCCQQTPRGSCDPYLEALWCLSSVRETRSWLPCFEKQFEFEKSMASLSEIAEVVQGLAVIRSCYPKLVGHLGSRRWRQKNE